MAGPGNMDIPDDKTFGVGRGVANVCHGNLGHEGLPVQKGLLAQKKKKKAVCSASTSQSHSNFSMFEIRISRLQIQ